MTRWFSFFSILVSFCTLALACGGGESRPGPLSHKLDDMFIAQVPIEEQQNVFKAQTEFNKAKAARAKANADYEQSGTDLEVAKNRAKQAELAENSAKSKEEAAKKRGNENEVNSAGLAVRAAKLAKQSAQKKVEYLESKRAYQKDLVLYAEDQMYAKEAKFELTKARLAQEKNIRPKGFNLADFEKQNDERSRYVQRTRAKVEGKRGNVDKMKQEWQRLEKEAENAKSELGGSDSDLELEDIGN